jgi:hypothetical protein
MTQDLILRGEQRRDEPIGSRQTSMRWLMIALLVSVMALLVASAGLAHHIWQERRKRGSARIAPGRVEDVEVETEEAP